MSGARTATIVAAATPPGRGGIGIVRVSGARAAELARVLLGRLPAPRRASVARFTDAAGEPIDTGLALFFPGPRSYTGEDVLELHGHGGTVVIEAVIARLIELGAERAEPGEFTLRAFLNGKLDLAQAEAVADLIDAGSRAAARAALRSLEGDFSARILVLREGLIELRTRIEAAIDFPEEEVDFLSDPALRERLETLRAAFDAVEAAARQGRRLRDGLRVVIAGRPNVGKSSLLNRLAGYDAAIVAERAGTTRDIVRERLDLDGLPLEVLDTAGLRAQQDGADCGARAADAPADAPADAIEVEGMRRAREAMARADRVLFVIDAAADPGAAAFAAERARLPGAVPVTLVFNKWDLLAVPTPAPSVAPLPAGEGEPPQLAVSARTGLGLEALRAHLKAIAGFESGASGTVSARARHLEALRRARLALEAAARELAERRAGELVAEELRAAQQALGEITGEFTSDDLLGRIFTSFCIGK